MSIKRTSCHTATKFINQLPCDGESSNASRPGCQATRASDRAFSIKEGEMLCQEEKTKLGGYLLECAAATMRAEGKIRTQKSTTWITRLVWVAIAGVVILTCLGGCANEAWAEIYTEASYYTVESTRREGTGCGIGLTASGEILKDESEYTFAHATLPFGTRCIIENQLNHRKVVARCNDRGPAARLRRLGRQIDTNLATAKALGFVQEGVAPVYVEVTHD